MRASVWSWLLDRLVPRVPDSIAACEFDCRTPMCRQGDWARCPRRLGVLADEPGRPLSWPPAGRDGARTDPATAKRA
jgi:hypothetical protein